MDSVGLASRKNLSSLHPIFQSIRLFLFCFSVTFPAVFNQYLFLGGSLLTMKSDVHEGQEDVQVDGGLAREALNPEA